MLYVKITCSNGYCGCDEIFYEKFEDNVSYKEINDYATNILQQEYSFYEPDDRFCDVYNDEEYEAYQQDCYADWGYISKEEYGGNL